MVAAVAVVVVAAVVVFVVVREMSTSLSQRDNL